MFNRSSTAKSISEDSTDGNTRCLEQVREKPNTAERIKIIQRTLRRQSTSNAPVKPPKHSIMAGFAGFLNMTTATCNTGVPEERRMSIPIEIPDDRPNVVENSKTILPYSNLPPVELSQVHEPRNSFGSNSSSSGSICASNVGMLRTRWSDSNVIESKRGVSESWDIPKDGGSPPIIASNMERPRYYHSISLTIKDIHKESSSFSSNKAKLVENKALLNGNRIRSDSIACTHPEKDEKLLEIKGIHRSRNNSDPHVTIRVTGKTTLSLSLSCVICICV